MQHTKILNKSSILYLANQTLYKVLEKEINLNVLLSQKDPGLQEPIQMEIVYGVLRYYFFLKTKLTPLLSKKLKRKDADIELLILMGIYQIHFMKAPVYAAVNETVSVCEEINKGWAKGLVNAILRKVSEQTLSGPLPNSDMPAWLSKKLEEDFPKFHKEIKAAFLNKPQMTLRINTSKVDPLAYLKKLEEAGISVKTTYFEEAIILENAQPYLTLPGWDSGLVSIQDFGAINVGRIFAEQIQHSPISNKKILDACAAPGGKLFHVFELMKRLSLETSISAIEIKTKRLKDMLTTAGRLGHEVHITQGDATQSDWWDQKQYTHILVDAPCTSSGTIAKNPDVKVLLNSNRIKELQEKQFAILSSLWEKLAPGGSIFYSTCSLFNEENDNLIQKFLKTQPDSKILKMNMPKQISNAMETNCGWYLLPFDKMSDGFYCSLISKAPYPKELQ